MYIYIYLSVIVLFSMQLVVHSYVDHKRAAVADNANVGEVAKPKEN